MLRCWQKYSNEHSYTHRSDSGQLCSTDSRHVIRVSLAQKAKQSNSDCKNVKADRWECLLAAWLKAHVLLTIFTTPHHCTSLQLRRKMSIWGIKWCSVVFIDNNRWHLHASGDHLWLWKRYAERYLPKCIRLTLNKPKHSYVCHKLQLSLVFWCFGRKHRTALFT